MIAIFASYKIRNMEKDIHFVGYTAVPSDYECSDGELTQAYNLINEDGAYKSLLDPQVVFNLGENQNVIYVHKTTNFTHYIIFNTETKKLLWTIDGRTFVDLYNLRGKTLYQVSGIGNTLIALTNNGMYYFLWKGDTSGYLALGNNMPELSISFGLQGEMERSDSFEIEFDKLEYEIKTATKEDTTLFPIYNSDGSVSWVYPSYKEFSDENKKKITPQVLGKVNKFIADRSTNKGRFLYPFFVRYAYRLYDGSIVRHSAPVLMVCSTGCAPVVLWETLSGKSAAATKAVLRVVGMLHKLDYTVIKPADLEALKNWSDIVKSVDIFISKPIYTYDQNGECDRFYDYNEYGPDIWGYSISKHINQAASTTTYPVRYQKKSIGYLYQMTFDKDHLNKIPGGVLGLPRKDTPTVKEDIRSCNNFYLLESIKVDQLATTRTIINVEEDYLQSLTAREVMTDDYDSHDKIIPKYAFGYNARINLTNIKKTLFNGYNTGSLFPYTDGYINVWEDADATLLDRKVSIAVSIYIKIDGKDIVVRGMGSVFGTLTPTLFIYYPNIHAYKAIVTVYDGVFTHYEVPLEAHGFLNGAFYFDSWDELTKKTEFPIESSEDERTIDLPNKIYTSEINNPFYFPVTGINTIGTGRIIGIATAAKALSQGQFGQFPLYAFTNEGVWALEVSSSGGYSAKQPITRDVCISSDSITQIDSAVLFATDRGIMEISGSQTQCITDIINGNDFFSLERLPGLTKLYPYGIPQVDCTFSEYRKGARMAYDYVNQRIIVFNATKTYAYVYSMRSKLWGIMASSVTSVINTYPNAYAMARIKTFEGEGAERKEIINNCLVDLSRSTETHSKGLLVTRPIKLDVGSMLKTFDTVFLRGLFGKKKVQTVLYGSRDNISWYLIHSAKEHYLKGFRGTPYKYFRIVAITDLSIGETLVGATVAYTPRLVNQIR